MGSAKRPVPDGPPPTGAEIEAAITRWRAAEEARKAAYDESTAARIELADVLHRAGLFGFSL